jgi:DNA polymerase-3 subunit epsilon
MCSLTLARQLLDSPNHRLQTCCTTSGIELTDAHTALGDVRATAQLIVALLDQKPHLRWVSSPPAMPRVPVNARPRTRASQLRRGEEGWMSSLLSKLPLSTSAADDGTAQAYLSAAESALEDGKLTGDEARGLARLAGAAGLGAAQVAALNRRLLDALRDAALEDDILTTSELAQLNRAAALLAVPDYFGDLVATVDDTPRAREQKAKASPGTARIWLHPELRDSAGSRVEAAGYALGKNLTRTLAVAVFPTDVDWEHPRAAKARELGVPLITIDRLGELLDEPATPPPYRGPTPPITAWAQRDPAQALPAPAWYPDPAGRYEHRYWDGSDWTEDVLTDGVRTTDAPRI